MGTGVVRPHGLLVLLKSKASADMIQQLATSATPSTAEGNPFLDLRGDDPPVSHNLVSW